MTMETYEFILKDAGNPASPSWRITASSPEEAWPIMAATKSVSVADAKNFITLKSVK